jgi:uncharacterized membrane protein
MTKTKLKNIGRNRKRKGQAMVESTFVLLAAIMMLVGTFDLAQIFFVHQSLVERTRLTSRYAASNYSDPNTATNYFLYGTATQPGISTATFLGVQPSMVSVVRYDANTNNDRMQVSVRDYNYQFIMPYMAGIYTGKPIVATAPTETRDGW